ncbi:MAG: hypothetical protein ACFFG0_55755, partial [Candidatus Thorarchaeota archaeon]
MKDLLKSFDLSDNSIKIYTKCFSEFPKTLYEIKNLIPDASEKEIRQILDDLIEKKLIILINPKYSEALPHYIFIPPFSAMLNSIIELQESSDVKEVDDLKNITNLERLQESLYQDLENISGELIDTLSSYDYSEQTNKILSEVEENVKKFAHVILNDVIGLISALRMQSAVDPRDFNRLINSVEKKISDSKEIVTNMFTQFKEIVNEIISPEKQQQVEAFKNFIRRLVELLENKIQELSFGSVKFSSNRVKVL